MITIKNIKDVWNITEPDMTTYAKFSWRALLISILIFLIAIWIGEIVTMFSIILVVICGFNFGFAEKYSELTSKKRNLKI